LLTLQHIAFLDVLVDEDSELVGQSVKQSGFSSRFSGYIISVQRDGEMVRAGIPGWVFQTGDRLRIERPRGAFQSMSRAIVFRKWIV
jgi:hypothetical protein